MSLQAGKRKVAPAVLLALLLTAGCATAPPVAKQDDSSPYTVRIPGTEPVELEAATTPPVVQPELPPTDADEKKGRWLRVIEVERTPRPSLPAPGEDSSAPAAPPGD